MNIIQGQATTVESTLGAAPVGGQSATIEVSKNGGAFANGAGSATLNGAIVDFNLAAGDVDTPGSLVVRGLDNTGTRNSFFNGNVVTTYADPLDAAATRAALGMAAANLDTQLNTIAGLVAAAAIRAAVGLANADLDTKFTVLGVAVAPVTMRANVGLASANLDTQLSGIAANVTAAAQRAAIGMAAANLDTQLAAILAASGSSSGPVRVVVVYI